MSYTILSSNTVYETKRMRIVHQEIVRPSGKRGDFDILERPDAVVIIPLIKDESGVEKIAMVRQYRHIVGEESLEFAGGGVAPNETLEQSAARELQEETGLTSDRFENIGWVYFADGLTPQKMHFFVARDCQKAMRILEEEEEDVRVELYSQQEVAQMIRDRIIKDSPAITAFHLFEAMR